MDAAELRDHLIEIQNKQNECLLEQVQNTLAIIAKSANQARLEVSSNGLTRVNQLITRTVSGEELKKAKEDNYPNLADLEAQSCFRRVTTALGSLTKVSENLDGAEENKSKVYLLKKLADLSNLEMEKLDHEMGKKIKFQAFGGNPVYERISDEDKAVNSQLSKNIAQTLGSASSLANSIHKAYEYSFILDNMQEQCEEIEKQNFSSPDELGQIQDSLKKLTERIPESLEERMIEKNLLENIQPTLESISKSAADVLANGIEADTLAEPIKKLTNNFNKISKALGVMNKYIQGEVKDADKTFILEKIGELSRRSLIPGSEVTLNSLLIPENYKKLSEADKLKNAPIAQSIHSLAGVADRLVDFVNNNKSPSSLGIITNELNKISWNFSSPQELLVQLKKSDLQSKLDNKSQLASGAVANESEKKTLMPTSVADSEFVGIRQERRTELKSRLNNISATSKIAKQGVDKLASPFTQNTFFTQSSYALKKETAEQEKTQKPVGPSHS